ncbi:MAG: TPM domain-containing protein [Planctomycetota bacterium]
MSRTRLAASLLPLLILLAAPARAWDALKEDTHPIAAKRLLTLEERQRLLEASKSLQQRTGFQLALVVTDDVGIEGMQGSAENTRKAWGLDAQQSVLVMVALDKVVDGRVVGTRGGVFPAPGAAAVLPPAYVDYLLATHLPEALEKYERKPAVLALFEGVAKQLATNAPPKTIPSPPPPKAPDVVVPPRPEPKQPSKAAFVVILVLLSVWVLPLQLATKKALERGELMMSPGAMSGAVMGGGALLLALGGGALALKLLDPGAAGALLGGVVGAGVMLVHRIGSMCPKCHRKVEVTMDTTYQGEDRTVRRVTSCPACGHREESVTKYVK